MDNLSDVTGRIEHFTRGVDLAWVADLLTRQREDILTRWLEATARQPFNQGRTVPAVSDHIPPLFDALVALLHRDAPRQVDPEAPLDDPAVLQAAHNHARARFEQGLQAAHVVTEFRLLRQEIGRALRLHLDDTTPTGDVVGAELLVHDALDGAIVLALSALTQHVEEVRDDFLAVTVHDVLQPVTTTKGNIQLALRELAKDTPNLQRTTELLRRADAGLRQLAALGAQLAEASRLALGQLEVRPVATDLAALVRDAVEQLDPESARRITLDIPPGTVTAGKWDPALLERVIANLLSNALKYAPPGSPITVSVRDVATGVQLSVQDRGVGLTEDDRAHLFQRYRRARGAVESGAPGLGLGLYFTRGVVEAHGGRIWAESAGPGQGTTMYVLLPRAAA